MAQLAIKGHPTRGKEVIQLLEMLGGNNIHNYGGTFNECYIIDNNKICTIYTSVAKIDNCTIFTLEEFEEKFPYKVGDEVWYKHYNKTYFIRKMFWKNDKVLYELSDEVYSDGCSIPDVLISDVDAVKLQPYKEETMEERENSVVVNVEHKQLKVHSLMFDKTQLMINDKYELVQEGNAYYIVCKKTKYPKTYVECAKILNCFSASYIDGYKNELLEKLQELLICRDAYWKIAGDWKYDVNKTEEYFYIVNKCGRIVKEHYMNFNHILAFPTEEMRDAFYENFNVEIELCKELL